jgi:hypothetical protein
MTAPPENRERDRPTGELLKELSDQTTTLVRQEIDLAKAELAVKGKKAGTGAGMFGGAGVVGFTAFLALTACIIAALDTAMPLWLAALTGKQKVQEAGPPVPEETRDSVKEDVQWAKTRARSGMT